MGDILGGVTMFQVGFSTGEGILQGFPRHSRTWCASLPSEPSDRTGPGWLRARGCGWAQLCHLTQASEPLNTPAPERSPSLDLPNSWGTIPYGLREVKHLLFLLDFFHFRRWLVLTQIEKLECEIIWGRRIFFTVFSLFLGSSPHFPHLPYFRTRGA